MTQQPQEVAKEFVDLADLFPKMTLAILSSP